MHRRHLSVPALVVSLIALAFSVYVYVTGSASPLAPPADVPTFSLPAPELSPQPVDVTSGGLCTGLLDSSVLNFMGDSLGTPDAFDVGCHYKGDHGSALGVLYYPGTEQFGTDYYIARADYGAVTVYHHRFGVPELYIARANLPQGWHNLLVEWVAPGCIGDIQLKIGWQGSAKPLGPVEIISILDRAFFGQTGPTITQLAGAPLTAGAGPRPIKPDSNRI
jgi:hypothetical protein